mmetsp:Transcript_40504/g.116435  ORF Transcript_40504/g.116435 Transcript_40504/m.116435 type:complete len:222 (-) Transcript_40504:217-882(-)
MRAKRFRVFSLNSWSPVPLARSSRSLFTRSSASESFALISSRFCFNCTRPALTRSCTFACCAALLSACTFIASACSFLCASSRLARSSRVDAAAAVAVTRSISRWASRRNCFWTRSRIRSTKAFFLLNSASASSPTAVTGDRMASTSESSKASAVAWSSLIRATFLRSHISFGLIPDLAVSEPANVLSGGLSPIASLAVLAPRNEEPVQDKGGGALDKSDS